jgi:hypothetical protein
MGGQVAYVISTWSYYSIARACVSPSRVLELGVFNTAAAPERPPHRMLVAQEGEAAMARWPIVRGRS